MSDIIEGLVSTLSRLDKDKSQSEECCHELIDKQNQFNFNSLPLFSWLQLHWFQKISPTVCKLMRE